jgi:glycyl-tRNA synthetase
VVDAVLAAQSDNPAGAARAVKQLQAWVERDDWDTILPGYARCVRIIRSAGSEDIGPMTVDESKLIEPAEKALSAAVRTIDHQKLGTVDEFLTIILKLIPAIDKFFDDVLVMDEDKSIRQNRLALVGQVARLADGIADLSRLEGF